MFLLYALRFFRISFALFLRFSFLLHYKTKISFFVPLFDFFLHFIVIIIIIYLFMISLEFSISIIHIQLCIIWKFSDKQSNLQRATFKLQKERMRHKWFFFFARKCKTKQSKNSRICNRINSRLLNVDFLHRLEHWMENCLLIFIYQILESKTDSLWLFIYSNFEFVSVFWCHNCFYWWVNEVFFSPIIIIFFWSAFVYRSIVSTLDGKKLSIVFVLSYFTVIYEQRSVLCSVVAFCFASMKKKSLYFHKLILYHMVCGVDTWWYCSIHILHVSFFLLFSFWCIFHTFYELQFLPSAPPLFKWKKKCNTFLIFIVIVSGMNARIQFECYN